MADDDFSISGDDFSINDIPADADEKTPDIKSDDYKKGDPFHLSDKLNSADKVRKFILQIQEQQAAIQQSASHSASFDNLINNSNINDSIVADMQATRSAVLGLPSYKGVDFATISDHKFTSIAAQYEKLLERESITSISYWEKFRTASYSEVVARGEVIESGFVEIGKILQEGEDTKLSQPEKTRLEEMKRQKARDDEAKQQMAKERARKKEIYRQQLLTQGYSEEDVEKKAESLVEWVVTDETKSEFNNLTAWGQALKEGEDIAQRYSEIANVPLPEARRIVWDNLTKGEGVTAGQEIDGPIASSRIFQQVRKIITSEPYPVPGDYRSSSGKKVMEELLARGEDAKTRGSYGVREWDKLLGKWAGEVRGELRLDVGAYLKAVRAYQQQIQSELDTEADPEDILDNFQPDFNQPLEYYSPRMYQRKLFSEIGKKFTEKGRELFQKGVQRIIPAAAKDAATTAAKTAATAAAKTATTVGITAAEGAATGVAAAVAWPVALLLIAKKVISLGIGLIKKGIMGLFSLFKIFAPWASSKSQIYFRKGLDRVLAYRASQGGVFSGEGFSGGSAKQGVITKKRVFLAALGSSSMVVALPAIIVIAIPAMLIFALIFYQFFHLPSALRAAPEDDENYGPPPLFEISKTAECKANDVIADCSSLPNNATYSVQYVIKIKSLAEKDLAFQITDVIKGLSETGELSVPQPVVPQALTLKAGQEETFGPGQISKILFSGAEFNDSVVNNTVTATGTVVGTTESQQKAAIATVVIGNPDDPPPYEFPLAGKLEDIDAQPIKAPDGERPHRGWFETLGKTIDGGTDIVGGSGEVVSTIDGIVEYSDVHLGNPTTKYPTCTSYQFSGGAKCLYKYGVGGAVYIRSRVGQYLVAYVHLDTPEVKPGDKIKRGETVLGKVYAGKLPTTTGAHIHYQVLKNGSNLNFADTNNAGLCSTGSIESIVHKQGDTVPLAPENCD